MTGSHSRSGIPPGAIAPPAVPRNAAAFNNRANALLRRRQYDHALQDYEEALRLDANNALYFRNRGNAYRIAGEGDRAKRGRVD